MYQPLTSINYTSRYITIHQESPRYHFSENTRSCRSSIQVLDNPFSRDEGWLHPVAVISSFFSKPFEKQSLNIWKQMIWNFFLETFERYKAWRFGLKHLDFRSRLLAVRYTPQQLLKETRRVPRKFEEDTTEALLSVGTPLGFMIIIDNYTFFCRY